MTDPLMPNSSEIEGLIARIEAATGPDREIDIALWRATGSGGNPAAWEDVLADGTIYYSAPPLTASIDASLALVERVRPECDWTVNYIGGGFGCTVWPTNRGEAEFDGHKETAPLSILLALLRALSAKVAP